MVSSSTKLQLLPGEHDLLLLAKAKKTGGKGPYQKERLGGARPPRNFEDVFSLFSFLNEKCEKYCDLSDGLFYFWGGWVVQLQKKSCTREVREEKSCTRKHHLGASMISFMNDISNC